MKVRFKNMLSILLCLVMILSAVPLSVFAAETDTQGSVTNGFYTDGIWEPGGTGMVTYDIDGTDVSLSKTAEAVPGLENTFDITLEVETSTSVASLTNSGAVVLVIDVSGSMNGCTECGEMKYHHHTCPKYEEGNFLDNFVSEDETRMQAAIDAGVAFLNSYAGTDAAATRMLSIVTFATGYKTVLDWTNVAGGTGVNGYEAAYGKINQLSAEGGTNLEGGLFTAKNLLDSSNVTGIENKSVVLLTDGIPTFRIDGGTGSYGSPENNSAASSQAVSIREKNTTLYTVCFGVADEPTYKGGPTVGDFLRDSVASSGCAYNADNAAELAAVFQAITESITSGLSGEGWTAVDPMADMISVNGMVPANFTSEDGNTYTWRLDDAQTRTEGNVTSYVYTCTYRVILDVQAEGFVEGRFYPTNDATYLNIGDEQYAFPVPGVKGVLPRTEITVVKTWSDGENQDNVRPDSVTVQLKKNGNVLGDAVILNSDNGWSYTWTDLIEMSGGVKHTYNVEEINVPQEYEALYSAQSDTDGDGTVFNIVNSHEVYKKDITVTKIWDDNDDQDGIRPESIKVNLLADGIQAASAVVTAENNWTYTFKSFPVNREGKVGEAVDYTVTEDDVEGYEATIDGLTITNTHEVEKTSVSVSKQWNDADNQDGIRPNDITVKLIANGIDTEKTLTLNEGGNWTGSFTDLDKYSSGAEVNYTVAEVEVSGYETTVTGSMATGYTITNSHTPEVVEVCGSKTWDDNDNQDGARPESITVNLLKNGTIIDSRTVTEADKWSWSFSNLPKYEEYGTLVNYSITENEVEDYTTTYQGYDVINTHTPEKTSVTVSKAWDDNNNQDGIRPNDIVVALVADGEVTGQTLILSSGNNWTDSFTGLDKYADGIKISYTVQELEIEGYTTVITGNQENGYIITNTHTPEVVEISGRKIWDDNSNQDGTRPESIIINLLKNGEIMDSKVITANSLNNKDVIDEDYETNDEGWSWSFTNLPKYENGGQEISYSITEEAVEGYSTTYDGYDVINIHTPEKTSVTVSKAWEDNNDQDGIRPDEITVVLLADGERTKNTLTLNPENNWTGSFTELDKYANGAEIIYTIEETAIQGYNTVITGTHKEGFIITNSHTPAVVEVCGTKTWDDDNDRDGVRPESITINLLKNGEIIETKTVTAADAWSWKFTNLPKFENNGSEIVYTITEKAVEGYNTIYDGYNVTNSYKSAETSITVTKAWADSNNAEGIRPKEVTIKLYANGSDTGKTLVLSSANNWTGSFIHLAKYADGELIHYTVEEAAVKGYNTVIKGTMENGFTVTNSHTYSPQTGDDRTPMLWFSLLAAAGLMIVLTGAGFLAKKKRRDTK